MNDELQRTMTITRFRNSGEQLIRLQLNLTVRWCELDEDQAEQLIEYVQSWVNRIPTKDHP